MTVNDELAQLYAHADAAEALEHEAASAVSAPLRDRLQAVSVWLAQRWVVEFGSLTAPGTPEALPGILAELHDRLSRILLGSPNSVSRTLTSSAQRALSLGIEQASAEIGRSVPVSAVPGLDSLAAATRADTAVADRLARAQRLLSATPGNTHADVMQSVALAHAAVADVERAARWITNREVNIGSAQVADALDAGTLWIAERDGCVHCLAYSGVLAEHGAAFPPDLTFGTKPLTPWPDGVLIRPPLHPGCRCRITPWLGHDAERGGPVALPEALQREARRSILKGWSLDSESEGVRLLAADRLLQAGADLPKSVEQQARRAVKRGRFASRTVPAGP